MLITLCVVVGVVGVVLILLNVIPGVTIRTPGGLNAGITLLVVAVVLYVVLALTGVA